MNAHAILIVLAGLLPILVGGCSSSQTAAQDREPGTPRQRDQFAQDQVMEMPRPAPFDPDRAMKYLRQLCDIGPRISGSEGMLRQQKMLKEHFQRLGGQVAMQPFEARQYSRGKPTPMANLLVTWHPERERRIILCGHYDTRPIADQEPDRRNWTRPFVSANDGTSTVAWLMELAHHIRELPLQIGVDFVLFDGEEYIFESGKDEYFLGSKHFASEYRRQRPKHRYIAGVLLDLFAGTDASFPIEQNSHYLAGGVVEDIWRTADALGVRQFRNELGHRVDDDHLALNNVGIPTVDIIDFDYAHWHRLSDIPENCSPESMAVVAKVLTVWLQRVK